MTLDDHFIQEFNTRIVPLVSLVERAKKVQEDASFENRVRLLNVQEEYCRKGLVVPSFAEFERIVMREDGAARKIRDGFNKAKAVAARCECLDVTGIK
jgi:hypothetical protein